MGGACVWVHGWGSWVGLVGGALGGAYMSSAIGTPFCLVCCYNKDFAVALVYLRFLCGWGKVFPCLFPFLLYSHPHSQASFLGSILDSF